MRTATTEDVPRHLLRDALKRRWWIVVVCVLFLTGLVGAASYTKTSSYTATSTVLLRPLIGNALDPNSAGNSTQVTIAMETEAGLVKSPDVATLVSRQLGRRVPAGTTQVRAMVPTNTETVKITFSASDPVRAREGAEAFASSFLQARADRASHTNTTQLQQITKQSQEAQKSLVTAMKAAAVAHTATTDSQVQLYSSRVSALEDSASQLKAAGTNPGFVVIPATAPSAADGVNPAVFIAIAAVLGLIFGSVIAVWRERTSDAIRSAAQDSVFDIPILSLLPARRSSTAELLTDPAADEMAKDAYRRARVGTLARVSAGSVIAVSDLSHTDRAGEICANLALSLAEAGQRTTVVDATLDGHDVTNLLGDDQAAGLSDTLASTDGSVPHVSEEHGLRVLGAGTASAAQMRDLYAGSKFKSVLDRLRKDSDIVLVAAPPATSPEGNTVAFGTDGVILVLADGRTSHSEVHDIISRNTWLGVHVVGLICASHQRRRSSHRQAPQPVMDELALDQTAGDVAIADNATTDERTADALEPTEVDDTVAPDGQPMPSHR